MCEMCLLPFRNCSLNTTEVHFRFYYFPKYYLATSLPLAEGRAEPTWELPEHESFLISRPALVIFAVPLTADYTIPTFFSLLSLCFILQGDQKVSVHLMITVHKHAKIF
jgi:hypothetical protein